MMNARPSSIGEILDRAIAIYVPRCLPLFIILAVIALPIALIQSAVAPGFSHTVDLFRALASVPPGHPAETQRVLREFNAGSAGAGGAMLLIYLAQGILMSLSLTALTIFIVAAIDGTAISVVAAYRLALRRWVPQMVVGCAYLMFFLGIAIALVIVGFIGLLAVAGINLISTVVAAIAGTIGGIALAIVVVVVYALLSMAWQIAAISVATEDPNPFRAIGRGLRRTLVRPLLRRSIGASAAVLAVEWFGLTVLASFGGFIVILTRLDVVNLVILAAGGTVINAVSIIFVLLYMRDVTLRREGSDLLAAVSDAALPV
jgi:hypothetical protein